jgi:hypothetical protein
VGLNLTDDFGAVNESPPEFVIFFTNQYSLMNQNFLLRRNFRPPNVLELQNHACPQSVAPPKVAFCKANG